VGHTRGTGSIGPGCGEEKGDFSGRTTKVCELNGCARIKRVTLRTAVSSLKDRGGVKQVNRSWFRATKYPQTAVNHDTLAKTGTATTSSDGAAKRMAGEHPSSRLRVSAKTRKGTGRKQLVFKGKALGGLSRAGN